MNQITNYKNQYIETTLTEQLSLIQYFNKNYFLAFFFKSKSNLKEFKEEHNSSLTRINSISRTNDTSIFTDISI